MKQKKIIILIFLIALSATSYSQQAGYNGKMIFEPVTGSWDYYWCKPDTKVSYNNYANPQWEDRRTVRASTQLGEGFDWIGMAPVNPIGDVGTKTVEEKKSSYGGKVNGAASATVKSASMPAGSAEGTASGGFEFSANGEVNGNVETTTSFKNTKEFVKGWGANGIAQRITAVRKGERVGIFCTKLSWQKRTTDGVWAWFNSVIGATGPAPDGYIYNGELDQFGQPGPSFFWANYKFRPYTKEEAETHGLGVITEFHRDTKGLSIGGGIYSFYPNANINDDSRIQLYIVQSPDSGPGRMVPAPLGFFNYDVIIGANATPPTSFRIFGYTEQTNSGFVDLTPMTVRIKTPTPAEEAYYGSYSTDGNATGINRAGRYLAYTGTIIMVYDWESKKYKIGEGSFVKAKRRFLGETVWEDRTFNIASSFTLDSKLGKDWTYPIVF